MKKSVQLLKLYEDNIFYWTKNILNKILGNVADISETFIISKLFTK